jgi:hypothetical protein
MGEWIWRALQASQTEGVPTVGGWLIPNRRWARLLVRRSRSEPSSAQRAESVALLSWYRPTARLC